MTLWCSICDQKQIDPNDKSTGKFYQVWGHSVETQLEDNMVIHDSYDRSIFATCPDCDLMKVLCELHTVTSISIYEEGDK